MSNVTTTLERANGPRSARPLARHEKRNISLGTVMDNLSKRNAMAGRAELLNTVLHALLKLCYEADDTGQPCNVCVHTGQILIPMPTGRLARQHWDIYRSDADLLRKVLILWGSRPTPLPIFQYDPQMRRWILNIWDYTSFDKAKGVLVANPVTVDVLRNVL